jgi:hypothetical protein
MTDTLEEQAGSGDGLTDTITCVDCGLPLLCPSCDEEEVLGIMLGNGPPGSRKERLLVLLLDLVDAVDVEDVPGDDRG